MKTIFWGYFSRASSIASNIIIMPFALAKFSAEEFSVWMVFVAFYALILVFDFGLSVTFSRQLNYVLSGAQSIERLGISHDVTPDSVSNELFSQVINATRVTFGAIALIATVVLGVIYPAYLRELVAGSGLDIGLAWLLYSLAIVIQVNCLTYNAIFFGTDNVASLYRSTAISNLAFFITAICLIVLDYGLLAVAVARFISAIAHYISVRYEVNVHHLLHRLVPTAKEVIWPLLKTILPNAARLGGVALGSFLVTRGSVFIVASYLPFEESATYALALNLFGTIASVSFIYMTAVTPKLNKWMQQNDPKSVKVVQKQVRVVCLGTAIFGAGLLLSLGPWVLSIIGSKTHLPELPLMGLFTLLLMLDVNRQISMNLLMTQNRVPFVKPTLVSGAAVLLGIIGAFEYGFIYILVPVLVQLVIQSLFNNWYWSWREFQELKKQAAETCYKTI